MEKQDKIFANGLKFNEPSENAPDFVVGRLWIKVDDFKAFLDEHNTNNGGVNIDIKRSTKGNVYCELSTWKPQKPESIKEPAEDEDADYSSIPF